MLTKFQAVMGNDGSCTVMQNYRHHIHLVPFYIVDENRYLIIMTCCIVACTGSIQRNPHASRAITCIRTLYKQ